MSQIARLGGAGAGQVLTTCTVVKMKLIWYPQGNGNPVPDLSRDPRAMTQAFSTGQVCMPAYSSNEH